MLSDSLANAVDFSSVRAGILAISIGLVSVILLMHGIRRVISSIDGRAYKVLHSENGRRLRDDPEYRQQWRETYGEEPKINRIN